MAKQWFSHKTKTCSKLKNLPFSLKSFDVSGQFHIKINVQISIFDTLKSTYNIYRYKYYTNDVNSRFSNHWYGRSTLGEKKRAHVLELGNKMGGELNRVVTGLAAAISNSTKFTYQWSM